MAKYESLPENQEQWLRIAIAASLILFVAELSTGSRNSYESHWFFPWGERLLALVFTAEYVARMRAAPKRLNYALSLPGIIDLVSILPFYVGFFVDTEMLRRIRTLRVLRVLKCYRYSTALQSLGLAFYRARQQLKAIAFALGVVVLFSMAAMYECEIDSQPDAFGSLFDSFWFTAVTITTVGYGDISPSTVAGRIVAIATFLSGLILFATFASVMTTSFTAALDERMTELESQEELPSQDQ